MKKYTNQTELNKAKADLSARLGTVKEIAEIWNTQKILPPMDHTHLENLISEGGQYMQNEATRHLKAQMAAQGIDPEANPTQAKISSDMAVFSRTIESLKRQSYGLHTSPHVNWQMITFTNGQPEITGATWKQLEAALTIERTPENEALLDALEKTATNATKAIKAFRASLEKRGVPVYRQFDIWELLERDAEGTYKPNLNAIT